MQFFVRSSSFVVFQVLGFNNNNIVGCVLCVCVFFANCYIEMGLRQQMSSGLFFSSLVFYPQCVRVDACGCVLFLSLGTTNDIEIIGVGFLISVWTYATMLITLVTG